MKRIAVFPGSFDPFTIGHESIVRRAIPLFDKIIIAIGHNSEKPGYFSLKKRIDWIKDVFKNNSKIEIAHYEGLTINFCNEVNAKYILRGIRTSSDFEYERAIAQTNKTLNNNIESIFLLTTAELTPINSSIVRDIIKNGGDISKFVPKEISQNI